MRLRIILCIMVIFLAELIKPCTQPPVTKVTVQQKTYRVNETIVFDGSGSYDQDNILGDKGPLWQYNFNDPNASGNPIKRYSDPIVYHSYSAPGTYNVSVVYRDDNAQWGNSLVLTINVLPNDSTYINAEIIPQNQLSGSVVNEVPPIYRSVSFSIHFYVEGFLMNKKCACYDSSDFVTVFLAMNGDTNQWKKCETKFDVSGFVDGKFTNVLADTTYYIGIKTRNSVRTWSDSIRISSRIDNPLVYYDFTTSAEKAWGSNLTPVIIQNATYGDRTIYCLYSGDVNQDGFVDPVDLSLIDLDSYNYASGSALATDLNGDGIVDPLDMSIAEQNSFLYIGEIKPDAFY